MGVIHQKFYSNRSNEQITWCQQISDYDNNKKFMLIELKVYWYNNLLITDKKIMY